ncbi:MAG TPA: ribosome maturation factor RimP [Hyphomonadaceae bacterium]|nr:ribosome maturation factor RimP [Hyphomonadaceae bacterium]
MRAQSEIELRILDLIEPEAKALGLDLVRVRLTGSRPPTLQIMAEKPDGTMDVEDCAKLSRRLSPLLDAEDPIVGEYSLEVSSPGIDRPLTRAGDFGKWIGHEVRVEIGTPIDGRKRFHGFIKGEASGVTTLSLKDGGEATIPLSEMVKAHLVLTDKLIKAAQAKGQAPAEVEDDEIEGDFDDVEVEDTDEDVET